LCFSKSNFVQACLIFSSYATSSFVRWVSVRNSSYNLAKLSNLPQEWGRRNTPAYSLPPSVMKK
jgi:hypothetical protein